MAQSADIFPPEFERNKPAILTGSFLRADGKFFCASATIAGYNPIPQPESFPELKNVPVQRRIYLKECRQ
jgi:hypothetical protein